MTTSQAAEGLTSMSITSSLNAGVAGLNANAARLATISDNIANSSTYGYRRAETDFDALVLGGSSGGYVAGGVRVSTMRVIDQGGPLVGTSNPLDLAISGRGMLPVRDIADVQSGEPSLLLVPTGSFMRDADGFIRTDNGLMLLGWPANRDGTMPIYPRTSVSGLQPVRIDASQRSSDPTTRVTLSANLPALATEAGASTDPLSLTVEYFGNLGNTETLEVTFTPVVPLAGSSNRWTMTVTDSAQAGTVIGSYTLVFDNTTGAGGTLLSVTNVAGPAFDPATGTIALPVASGAIDFQIGRPGTSEGLTQLASAFSLDSIDRNGSPPGAFLGVEIDEQGFVIATYDTGFTQRLYQVPLVAVPNQNGLQAVGRQAFALSEEAGAFMLWEAGTGPTGTISGYSREASATDIAAELTALIQTQRAYSSNAKVVTTVAFSRALPTALPVEISDCTRDRPELIDFMVCSATIAPLFVKIEDMSYLSLRLAPLAPLPFGLLSRAVWAAPSRHGTQGQFKAIRVKPFLPRRRQLHKMQPSSQAPGGHPGR